MHVPVAAPAHPVLSPKDLRVLDGSSLSAHLALVYGTFTRQGASCAQEDLQRGARCAAEVLLQLAPPLVEVRQRAVPLSQSLLGGERCCMPLATQLVGPFVGPYRAAHIWCSAMLSHMQVGSGPPHPAPHS